MVTGINWLNLGDNLQSLDSVFDLMDLSNSLSDNSSNSDSLLRNWSRRLGWEVNFWDWLGWSNSVNSLLDRSIVLLNSLNDLLNDRNLSDDLWSLLDRSFWKGSLQSVDLNDQLSDSSDNLLFSDDKLLVNLLNDFVHWSWSWSVIDDLLLELDSSNSLLDVNNLLVKSLNNLLELNNSLSENWSLGFWDFWKFLSELLDVLSNNDNSLDQFGDLLLKNSDDFLLNLGDWSWFSSFFSGTWLAWLGTVLNRVDGLFQDAYLLNEFLVDSLEDLDLLSDGWSSRNWSGLVNLSQSLDSLSNLGNLLVVNISLVNQFVDNSFFNLNQRSLLVPNWGRFLNVGDNLSDLGDLVGDLFKSLFQNVNFVNELWLGLFWLLR